MVIPNQYHFHPVNLQHVGGHCGCSYVLLCNLSLQFSPEFEYTLNNFSWLRLAVTTGSLNSNGEVSLGIYPPWISVEPGTVAELQCTLTCNNASVCQPLPDIIWKAEGQFSPNATQANGRLIIPSASSKDEQFYFCSVPVLSLSEKSLIIVKERCE